MFAPPTQDIVVARADSSINADALAGAIRNAEWPGDAIVLKDRADGTVCRRTLAGLDLVFKTEPITSAYRRLQVRLGLSRARRSWNGAAWLLEHRIPTARPLALIDGSGDGRLVECIVLETIEGSTLLGHLISRPDPERLDPLAEAVGHDIAAMFLAGRYNRDHKPSNLIVHPTEPRVAIIDTVAIRPIAPGFEPLERMLASLVLEPTLLGAPDPSAFMEQAARTAASRILDPAVNAERYLDKLLARVRRRVDRHDGPTPRHESSTPAPETDP